MKYGCIEMSPLLKYGDHVIVARRWGYSNINNKFNIEYSFCMLNEMLLDMYTDYKLDTIVNRFIKTTIHEEVDLEDTFSSRKVHDYQVSHLNH